MIVFKDWIEDYNNVASHSGWGLKSPVEYRDDESSCLVEMGVKSK